MDVMRALVELATGRRCVGCGDSGVAWCDRCLATRVDVHARRTPDGFRVTAGARYEGEVRGAIVAHKEQGQLSLAVPLARLVSAALGAATAASGAPTNVLLVPVPSTSRRVRERGHDHTMRLSKVAARIQGSAVATPLRWGRRVVDQSGLGVEQRRMNVQGAMRAKEPSLRQADRVIFVLDDIMTSGATIDEARRALTAAGWQVSGAAVVASVDSRMALAPPGGLR